MKLDIKKLDEMFTQKDALRQALLALNKQQEEEIGKVMDSMFSELKGELLKHHFSLCAQPQYEDIELSVFTNFGKENEQSFTIDRFTIKEVYGERDETFNEVIKVTEEFLEDIEI
jgi:hypothetical protein